MTIIVLYNGFVNKTGLTGEICLIMQYMDYPLPLLLSWAVFQILRGSLP
jgi:hypothetical protein